MIKNIFITALIILSCLSSNCFAITEYKKVDLNDAIDIAQKKNLDIKAIRLNTKIAKNEIKQANRLQNPEINTFWNFGKSGQGNPQQIGMTQTIELGKRGVRKKLAKANLELVKEDVNFQEFNLRMDVREAYVKLVGAKSILKTYEEQQKLLENLLEISKKKAAAGAIAEMDVIQAQIALNQMITEVNKARVNVKTARIDFNQVINTIDGTYDSKDEELPTKGDFVDLNIPKITAKLPTYEYIEEYSLKNRFDIKVAKNKIESAKKNLAVVVHQRIPDLELEGGYGFQTKGMSDNGTYKSGGYVGVNLVNLPVFYTYRPEIQNAKFQVEQAETNYESTVNKARKSLENAYEKFVTSQMNLNYYNNKLIKDSNELIKLSKRSYEAGKSNLTALIVMEQQYREIVSGYVNALSDYYIDWVEFLREINKEDFDIDEKTL